jgi:hypothetical protein
MALKIGTVTVAPDEAPSDGITYGRKDGAWVDLTAPANLQVRRGTDAEVGEITPLEGEPVWVTDEKHLVVGDGDTEGGIIVPSAVGIRRLVSLSAAAYAAIETKDPDTLYVVTE